MPKNLSRFVAIAGVACLAILIAAPVYADNVPLLFNIPNPPFGTDTNQSFNGTVNLTGSVQAVGSASVFGIPVTIPNQTQPLSLKGIPSVASSPASYDNLGNGDLVGTGTNQLVDTNSLDLDLLNGQTADFAINTVSITTSLIPITIDASGTLSALTFTQTDGTVFTGSSTIAGGSGTFVINGDVAATISNLTLNILSGASVTTLGPQNLTTSFPLTGNWTVTPLGFAQRKVTLDGTTSLSVPFSIITGLVSTGSTLSANVSATLGANVVLNVSYHLETITVPEPGSIALLGVGLVALVPVIRRWRRK